MNVAHGRFSSLIRNAAQAQRISLVYVIELICIIKNDSETCVRKNITYTQDHITPGREGPLADGPFVLAWSLRGARALSQTRRVPNSVSVSSYVKQGNNRTSLQSGRQ